MPEGDTLFRIATTLGKALTGKVLTRFASPLPALEDVALEGRTVAKVEAHGKNLLIHFDDGRCLHTHLRMNGSWHLYRPKERWFKAAHRARAVLETADFVAVCFDAPVVELLPPGGVERRDGLATLGPDLLRDDFDAVAARRGLRARGDLAIGEAVMIQGALAGIGNIYKSETLFACRQDPFVKVDEMDDAALDAIIEKARALLTRNAHASDRRTRHTLAGPKMWAYGRGGQPCLRCGTIIQTRRQGVAGRVTYYCPVCQGVGG
jgi:endonuclease-8